MLRRMQPDGICSCCGKVGPTWACVEQFSDRSFATVDQERAELPPLCDACEYAQKRWDAARAVERRPSLWYPYRDGPPVTPPVRR